MNRLLAGILAMAGALSALPLEAQDWPQWRGPARDGRILWKVLDDRGSYASPMLAEFAGHKQLVAFTALRMVGIDLVSHELLWEYPFEAFDQQTIVSPVVWRNRVVIAGDQKPAVALEVERNGENLTTRIAWESKELRPYLTTPVLMAGALIGLDNRTKRLVRVEMATGRATWTGDRMGPYVSLVVSGDHLLALSSEGRLLVFKANRDQFELQAQWTVSDAGGTFGHLAVAEGKLFVKDREHLACFQWAP